MAAGTKFSTDELIAGKYKVISEIGTGGMGTVYRVRHVFLDTELALKTVDARRVSDQALRRFQVEARAASSLNHPSLVHVSDFGLIDDHAPYLVMEYVDGVTLSDAIKSDGALTPIEVAQVFAQACLGLSYAHEKGVVHRDIKSSNIMLVNGLPRGSEGSVKIVDFGIAKLTASEDGNIQALTKTGEIFGSPLYMSPEQCSGGSIDHRSDVYSLGCAMFEALTATPPHLGQNSMATMMLHQSADAPSLKEASLGRDFPRALEAIVAKMLCKAPSERYQNLAEAACDLADFARDGSGNKSDIKSSAGGGSASSVARPESGAKFRRYALLTGALLAGAAAIAFCLCRTTFSTEERGAGRHAPAAVSGSTPQRSDLIENNVSAEPSVDDMDGVNNQIVTDLSNAQPIESKVITVNKKRYRQLTFPKRGIGVVADYNRFDFDESPQFARGTVQFPAETQLSLEVQRDLGAYALQSPSFFKKIAPDEFSGLLLGLPDNSVKEMVSDVDACNKQLPAILKIVSKWSRLETLSLKNCELGEDDFQSLDQIRNLRCLQLIACSFHSSDLENQTFLNRLELLKIQTTMGVFSLDGVINKLAESKSLKEISLLQTSFSDSAVRNLLKCPTLTGLSLDRAVDDKTLIALSQCKHLHAVAFRGKVTGSQLKLLLANRRLRGVYLLEKVYSPAEAAKLRALDHRVRLDAS